LRDCLMASVTAVINASSFLSMRSIIPREVVENERQKTYTGRALSGQQTHDMACGIMINDLIS
jgi:hypothetical protein